MILKRFKDIKKMNLKYFYFFGKDYKAIYQVRLGEVCYIYNLNKVVITFTGGKNELYAKMKWLGFQEKTIISKIKYIFKSKEEKNILASKEKYGKYLHNLLVSDKRLRHDRNIVFKVLTSPDLNKITKKYITKLLTAKTEYKIYTSLSDDDLQNIHNITRKKKRQFFSYYGERKIHHIKELINNGDSNISYYIQKIDDNTYDYNFFILYGKKRLILNHMRKNDLPKIFGDTEKIISV